MDIMHTRCAGIDISKYDAKVAVRIAKTGRTSADVRVDTCGSSTPQVLHLRDQLICAQVMCVVMEATGDYWRTFYYLLEDAGFEILLANPREVRNRPGRKTDVSDAQWLAELGAFGLVAGSFVPPAPIRHLRALTRLRTHIARDRATEVQRLEKVLEDAGIKLSAVATDLTGVSSRAMLQGLADGIVVDDIVDMAKGALRRKKTELTDALTGRFTQHHGFMVTMLLSRIDACDQDIADLTQRIDGLIQPYQHAHDLLITIPGISDRVADVIIAETGADMTVFPDAKHLASWAGVAPGSNQSSKTVKPAHTRPGDSYLKGALGIAALSAARNKKSYFSAQYRRIATRRGPIKALVAVEASIITAVWFVLTRDTPHVDLGYDYFTKRRPDTTKTKAIQQLHALGYDVTLTPTQEPATG
jgi:transposase